MWTRIDGYPNYGINHMGAVCNRKTGKVLKPRINGKGYVSYVLTNESGTRKEMKAHRLVASAFIPNPDNLPEVNHRDENTLNNSVENLEWCTQSYNLQYSNARHYIFQKDNQLVYIYNLSKYCRDNNLSRDSMKDVYRNQTQQYAGYTLPAGG